MKNAFRIVIFMMLAAVLFVSCGDSAGTSLSGDSANSAHLFYEGETPIEISSLSLSDLSDGTWEFKNTFLTSNGINQTISGQRCNCSKWGINVYQTIVISGGNATIVSGSMTYEYTMDNASKEALINADDSLTWNGNTVIISNNDYTHDTWFVDIFDLEDYYTIKKNSTNTKFFAKTSYDRSDAYDRYYLRKK